MTEFAPINILERCPFVAHVDFEPDPLFARRQLFYKVIDELRQRDVQVEGRGDILYCTEAGFEKLLCHPVLRLGLLRPRFSALRPALAWTVASDTIITTRYTVLTTSAADCVVAIKVRATAKTGKHQIMFQSNVQEEYSRVTNPIDSPWYHEDYPKAIYKAVCSSVHVAIDIRGYIPGGLHIELIGLSDHPVDTHNHCFERAGHRILHEIIENAPLTLLEPVMRIEIDVPGKYMAAVLRKLAERKTEIEAQTINTIIGAIRVSNLLGFHDAFRRLTKNKGQYTVRRIRFDPIPDNNSP